MQAFTYSRTSTLSDAISAAASGATLIAGGTELVNWMKEAIVAPRQLVDINDSPGLDRIYLENGRLRIGALVRMSAAAAHADVVRQFPALAQAFEKSASAQIRNMATMGGNLLQRTRCPYFRADISPLQQKARRQRVLRHRRRGSVVSYFWRKRALHRHSSFRRRGRTHGSGSNRAGRGSQGRPQYSYRGPLPLAGSDART